MSFQLSPTNRSQIVTTGDRFVVAVAGNFRGGQLHVQFSVDGVFTDQKDNGSHIFEANGLRSFESNGEDIKLLWVGNAGEVNVSVTNLSATGLAFTEILGIPTVSRVVYPLGGDTFVVLSPDCRKISMVATGGNLRYILGDDFNFISDASQGHFILQNERLDVRLPELVSGVSPAASPAIYVFGDGELYISELE